MKTALEAAGSDLDHVLKCNVLCISKDRFKTFNEIYKRFFPTNPPAGFSSACRSGPARSTSRSIVSRSRRAETGDREGRVWRAAGSAIATRSAQVVSPHRITPARIFCVVPTWPGPFDIEMDCTAIRGEK